MKKLDKTQTELLLTNLDEDGKLSCLKAFKVARLIGMKPKDMAAIAKAMNIVITNCELGVFGKLKFSEKHDNIYNSLSQNTKDNKKVECEIAWKEAQNKGSTLKKVGSTIKNSDIKVTHCQLGCFYDEEYENFENIT
ncbi:ModE family transcriptional regulator [Malaciobacter marinus]|jgi:hypothetical protein|uniref:ModE family transcriptional regulator n=1 Tax=Malaciobacter marinus TaxID=505249 RepID=A0A1T4ZZZ8_9BACT|nr:MULTISPECIES: ModE family transcriptional regulator [Malaciobacter]AXX86829.1 hypothetical protein AMRN_1081 [Malaciobacter marinus]PHO13047.1 ModE family transcriptional regulator [Malaciobacter marinus]PHO14775.1 ModE family transcriptional regulator [Malaciobacter marinus]PPK62112.1 hypothetical protein B0F89_10545 [Malaciobacter marinus]RYA22409.1 ModE family transcriptional regulator [Malaciobacter halophilus]